MSEGPIRPYWADEQPAPRPGYSDVFGLAEVMLPSLLKERRERGLRTYGRPLETWNGRDAVRDALEEILDAFLYVLQEALEREDLVETMKKDSAVVKNLGEQVARSARALVAIRELLSDTSDCDDWLDVVARIDALVDGGLGLGVAP